jgi:hypothetical protein
VQGVAKSDGKIPYASDFWDENTWESSSKAQTFLISKTQLLPWLIHTKKPFPRKNTHGEKKWF